jgi:hypothetical protein
MLVGYEGDGGYIFKVWDPTARKIVVSRDIGFPQPGDEDGMGPMPVQPAPGPKDPDDDNDDAVGFMPVSLNNNDSKPDNKQQQIVKTLPVQTPIQPIQMPVTPSTIHLPTIHRSVSTMPETPREKPQQKAIVAPPVRQHKLFQTRLPTVQEEPLMTGARITDITNAPGENTQLAGQRASSITQRRADFGERLRTLSSQVSQLAESMQDVHKEADNIEKSVTEQSSETATRETTPSPEQQRVEYQYPFSSPIQQAASPRIEIQQATTQQAVSTQQASASPSREITQATETVSSTESTPVTARSEVSPRREIISIESSPDPISQDPATPAPPPSTPSFETR